MAKRINIPNVTGNITITVRTSVINIETPTVVANMTYGKGIDLATAVIVDNSACWATIDPVTVEQGKTYQISCDATWVWVYSFDDNDNFKSQLLLGSDVNPQTFTFNTDTTKIRYGCYDPDKQLSYCNLTKTSTKINLNDINDITVNKNESFYINYSTNISAVKHEFSWDGGETYLDKTDEIITENITNYKYSHQPETAYDYIDMSIRVTDANGNISIKFFRINFTSNNPVLANMTYGKGINMNTGTIIDNAECWATIDPVAVTQGQSYEITCNATRLWVYSFDESDNFVSALITGSDSNPQEYKFTANTSKIRYGCYDPNRQLTYCTLTESTEPSEPPSGLKDFPYADKLVEIAMTYWRNADKEYVSGKSWSQGTTYRSSNTPLSAYCESGMDVENSFWVSVRGRHYKAIDCSTLVGLCLRGYTYENGPYANKTQFDAFRTDRNQTNPSVSWAFTVPRTAADIGKYCYDNNWIVPLSTIGNSSNNYSGLKKGDLIFWAKKNTDGTYREPDRFMKISHVAIVYGNSNTYNNRLSVIESTSTTSKVHTLSDGSKVNCGVRIKDIANNKPDEVVLVARIQL